MLEISELSPTASRLLIALLLHGTEIMEQPKTKMMEILGVRDRRALTDAMDDLESLGFAELQRAQGQRTRVAKLLVSPFSSSPAEGEVVGINKVINILYEPPRDDSAGRWSLEPVPSNVQVGVRSNVPVPCDVQVGVRSDVQVGVPSNVPVPSNVHVPVPSDVPVPSNVHPLIVRCRIADAMDDSGDLMNRNSPMQKRRQAQIPLIQEAYAEYFPQDKYPLTEKNAKTWLGWNEESAAQVVEGLADIAHRKPNLESPVGYIRKVFEGEAQKRPTSAPVLSSSSAVPGRPTKGAAAYVPGGDLPEPTEEYLAELDEGREFFERYKRERGLLE